MKSTNKLVYSVFLSLLIIAVAMSIVLPLAAEEPAGEEKTISIQLDRVPILDALQMVVRGADISYGVQGEIPTDATVTMQLKNASPRAAFDLVCRSAGLVYDYDPANNVFLISAEPMARVGGVNIPVVAGMAIGKGSYGPTAIGFTRSGGGGGGGVGNRPFFGQPYGKNSLLREQMIMQGVPDKPFEEDGRIVNLKVENYPLTEALEELAAQAGVFLEFAPGVPKDLLVSTNIQHAMFDEALFLLTSQAHLIYSVETDVSGDNGTFTHLLVAPQPRLEATVIGVTEPLACPRCGYAIPSETWNFCCNCGLVLKKLDESGKMRLLGGGIMGFSSSATKDKEGEKSRK